MYHVLIFLATLASLIVLSQWFVIVSIRKYLFRKYTPVTRKFAYPLLALLGLLNYMFVRLVFDPGVLPPDSFSQQVAAVAFFSYLGSVLVLSVFFLLVGAASTAMEVKDLLFTAVGSRKRGSNPVGRLDIKGVGSPAAHAPHQETESSVLLRPNGEDEIDPPGESGILPPVPEEAGDCRSDSGVYSRRSFLKLSAATGLASAAILSVHGIARAYGRAQLTEFDIVSPALRGLDRTVTLIHITDFHFGMFFGTRELEKLVETVNSIEGDAVIITGDIFHSPLSPLEKAPPVLKQLKNRRYGNVAVMGNHDFYAGERRSVDNIEKSGLHLIRDEWLTFTEGSARIHLGGMDDPKANWLMGKSFPNFPAFMKKAPGDPGLRVLLSHRPAVLPLASRAGIDLILSGHIHGGQIVVPVPGNRRGVSLARIVSPYTHGWYRMGKSRMYLNRGVGLTFVPWRINCPPEIAVFRLKPPGPADVSQPLGEAHTA